MRWQRAWAQFRTIQSPIDYVRVSGLGVDPMLVNAAQVAPARARLVAQHRRSLRRRRHPCRRGPAPAALSGRAGARPLHRPPRPRQRDRRRLHPDRRRTATRSPAMMAEGVRRMDALFATALAAGRLHARSVARPAAAAARRGAVEEEAEPTEPGAGQRLPGPDHAAATSTPIISRWPICARWPGIESASPQQINPGGTSYVLVSYRGSIAALAAALRRARLGGRMSRHGRAHPVELGQAAADPAAAAAASRPPPQPPTPQPQPASQPQPGRRRSEARPGPDRAPARLAAERGRRPLHRVRRQPRRVRPFPPMEPVAGQGDDPHRAAAVGPHACSRAASSSGSAGGCSTRPSSATRRSCSTPGTRPRTAAGRWSWSPTGRRRPGRRGCPICKTRLAVTPVATIEHPDDALVRGADPASFRRPRAAHSRRGAALHGRAAAPRLLDRRARGRGGRPLRDRRAGAPVAADGPPGAGRSQDDRRRGGLAADDRRDPVVGAVRWTVTPLRR